MLSIPNPSPTTYPTYPTCGSCTLLPLEDQAECYSNSATLIPCITTPTPTPTPTPTCGSCATFPPEQQAACYSNSATFTPCSTPIPGPCPTCNPTPGLNFCDITTSCIGTSGGKDYCACRAGYRADGLSPTDPKQFRLNFSGQAYRVFVAPGVSCNTLCMTPFGLESCQEVPVQTSC